MRILVTGVCGYIGSHTAIESVLQDIKKIVNKEFKFYKGDMLDRSLLEKIFKENDIDGVIDFAAYKAVGESKEKPIEYYINNVSSVLNLLSVMKENNVKTLVFSSSATVYGSPKEVPIKEDAEIGGTTNPYGTSKLFVEKILNDLYDSDNTWNICILRYFNPIGAHKSGFIGENPNGIPANLVPYVAKVAKGELDHLNVFGNDYNTKDGTGVRDYIHVVDLSRGHVQALKKLEQEKSGLFIYNLGTGIGYSVLDIIKTFEKVNNIKIPYEIAPRRSGDIDICYSNPEKAKKEIGFVAKYNLEDMLKDAWNYEKNSH